MRIPHFIIILLIGQSLMACNYQDKAGADDKYEWIHGKFTSEEEIVEPPPPDYVTRFGTIEEWLFYLCDKEQPAKPIATYNFGLFEGDEYTLCLTGSNTHELSQYHSKTNIDYAPQDMYFTLSQTEYKDLSRDKVLERLTSELKSFTTSDKFKNSFFSQANSITTDWKGEIWSK